MYQGQLSSISPQLGYAGPYIFSKVQARVSLKSDRFLRRAYLLNQIFFTFAYCPCDRYLKSQKFSRQAFLLYVLNSDSISLICFVHLNHHSSLLYTICSAVRMMTSSKGILPMSTGLNFLENASSSVEPLEVGVLQWIT
jgi:hypothetical protein